MGLKELILNKGWAGKTMGRPETIERLNPLIRLHCELNHSYDFVIENVSSTEVVQELEILQKIARVDVGKLSETVLSSGGVAYSGTDLEPEDFHLGLADGDMLRRVKDLESEFEQQLTAELDENHQIRTKAVLSAVLGNSKARIEYLRVAMKSERQKSEGQRSERQKSEIRDTEIRAAEIRDQRGE